MQSTLLPHSLRLFGGFAVEGPDGSVDLPTSAQRVVAYLALQDRPVRRARLAGVLWPDTTDVRAAANLRSALWRTRRSAALIGGDNTGLTLSPLVDVDVHRLRGCAEDAMLARLRGSSGAIVVDLELLPDWYEDWVVAERERLRQIVLRTFSALVRRLVADGRAEEAIDIGLDVVRLEPLCETSQQSLIAAYLAAGDRAAHSASSTRMPHSSGRSWGCRPPRQRSGWCNTCCPGSPRALGRHLACGTRHDGDTVARPVVAPRRRRGRG